MNENLKKMNKLDLFKSYNNNISDGDITSIIKVYDKKYVTLINNLSSLISNFVSNTKAFIKALSEVCSTMKNQILYSQHLLLEINNKKEKFSQLCDRVEMIDNTRKLLDNHLLIINNNLNIFITEAKKEFKDIINLRMEKLNAISKMKNNKKCDSLYNNKSTSRAKIKKKFFEMENYFSNDNIASNNNNNKKNVYNNFIQCSDMQKNYSLLEKQNNYRKANFNQSQEQFYPKKNENIINKQKSESVLRGKYSRNKINVFQNSFSSRYNNSSTIAKQIEQPGKSSRNNSNGKDINSIELKLAYKVLEFIFIINNFQLQKNKNYNSEIIAKIETLKNNLMTLTKEVINQNKNKANIKNKNIINNNFIYNNKENKEIKDDENSFNDYSRDMSMDQKDLYEQIEKLKAKNQDLELLLKIKNKENKKLNKILNDKTMYQTYQGKNIIKINNNSSEKLINKKYNNSIGNVNKKVEPKAKNDEILFLNKKIEELNSTIKILKKEKMIINNDLTGKINSLIDKNSSIKSEYENLINNLNKDIKDKDIQIKYLNSQINQLKEQIENKNSLDNIKINLNDSDNDNNIYKQNKPNINEYDYKMFMLKEKNKYFQDTLNSFDEKIKFNEKDIEQLKNNINTNINKKNKVEFKIYKTNFSLNTNKKIKKENKFSPDKYEILCDKYFNNIHWFLLINKKDKENSINDFHKMFWAEKSKLTNIENFNKYTSEAEEENKNIIKYISKLEEKEDTISKLNYKLNQLEKLNSQEDINIIYNKTEKMDNLITKDKYNNLLSKLKNLENEIKILKQENMELKDNINAEKEDEENINNKNNKSYETDEYKKFEEKFKKDNTKINSTNKKLINNFINNSKESKKDDSPNNNYINISNEINEEITDKITEQVEEENESIEKSSESIEKNLQNKILSEKSRGTNNLQRQLDRITKLYEELDKKLKKIKNEIKQIFTDVVIKEKEKEIKALFETCGFTEDEISEMLMYTE